MSTSINEEVRRRFILQEEYLGNNKTINKIKPLVSVIVITYQHAAFIKECLEGILIQKVDFPFEIILGEDASTDGTREICIEYAQKHQDKIRLFLRDRNLTHGKDDNGLGFNGFFAMMSGRGKYYAFCEGDDYWTDSSKLQRQVDILESHADYSLCFHNAKILFADGSRDSQIYCPPFLNDLSVFNTNDLIKSIVRIPTNTMVFRPDWLASDVPSWYFTTRAGEKTIQLFTSLHGKIVYLDRIMSVYRLHPGSISYNQTQKYAFEVMSKLYNNFNITTDYKYGKAIAKRLKQLHTDYVYNKLRIKYGRSIYIMKPQWLLRKILSKIDSILYIRKLKNNGLHK